MSEPTTIDDAFLRDAFLSSRATAARAARWAPGDPGAEPDTCRYCGTRWRQWAGSKLDGHAACVVTRDFKQQLADILRASPEMTYAKVAAALGVTPAVVRSWTYPIKIGR